ncbi:MAG: hypothetical protein M3007_01315 [Candidatus Eremiobacteraeota bacterium]|nr:hypothetical protein [Candidatus Eremiobacteraeota bacterium]
MTKALVKSTVVALSLVSILATAAGTAASKSTVMHKGNMPAGGWELGTWSCQGRMMAVGRKPARTENSTLTMQLNAMTRWVDISSSENGRMGFMGHMSRAPHGVFAGIDNEGDAFMETMGGWAGHTMTMTGTMSGPHGSMRVRDTVTRNSGTSMRHESFAYIQGAWKRMAYENCTKM